MLRITLDADNAPLFYETIAACGCFHKVFVERWVEEAARQTFGPPEKDKKFSVERTVKDAIDWEVAGVVDEPREQPRRPVVFLKAGDHKVIGMGSAARLRVPPTAEKHPYEMTSYADLYRVKVDGSGEPAAFFDMDNGGKVRGAERKQGKIPHVVHGRGRRGTTAGGRPDQDALRRKHLGRPTIYGKYLRLPPGSL